MKKSVLSFFSVAALCLLLLQPSQAFEGAKNGLLLWAGVVLPTLLPFMICSNVIVALNGIPILIWPFKHVLRDILKLSDAGSYVLVSGLLCGYPMGARNCSDFLDDNRITRREGQYLLAICNHPSPMFLLGYTASFLPAGVPVWLLLCAAYLPILPLALAAGRVYGVQRAETSAAAADGTARSFDESLMDSCEVMVKIGGYIMLFSILVLYITNLPIFSADFKAVLLGFVEITTGIRVIAQALPGAAGSMWIAAAVAFGGMSGIFQTKSVLKNAGLSIRHYVAWKLLHSVCAALIFLILAPR